MLIDTHAHVNFAAFKDDAEEVLKRCSDNQIGVVNIGSQYSTSKRAVEMADKHENVWAVVGLHPSHLAQYDYEEEGIKFKSVVEKFDAQKYRELAKSKKVVAIGEVGLDYHHISHNMEHGTEEKKIQKDIFVEQIKLATELDLPLVVHCRNAYKDILEIIISEKKKYGDKLRGVMHSYLGRLSYAEEFNKLGFHIAFNGIITYARDYDKVIKNTDLKNILVETDCPWLTPVPHRGERNEPAYVKFVAGKIAEIKNINVSEVENITTQNAKNLFQIYPHPNSESNLDG